LIDILILLRTINYWRRFKQAQRVRSERQSKMTSEAFEYGGDLVGSFTVMGSFYVSPIEPPLIVIITFFR
jgi:hypothetical protein